MTHVVLVCGSRSFKDSTYIGAVLDGMYDKFDGDVQIVHGGAPGADTIVDNWCETKGIMPCVHVADWARYGKGAGPIRNREMLEHHPDLIEVIAFVDKALERSKGTRDMVEFARKNRISTAVIYCRPGQDPIVDVADSNYPKLTLFDPDA